MYLNNGLISFGLNEILKNELSEKIQAFDQLTYQLLTENRWAHPNK